MHRSNKMTVALTGPMNAVIENRPYHEGFMREAIAMVRFNSIRVSSPLHSVSSSSLLVVHLSTMHATRTGQPVLLSTQTSCELESY